MVCVASQGREKKLLGCFSVSVEDSAENREQALAERPDYVLIQFGHNNEPGKPGRSTDMPTFVSNMVSYAQEARADLSIRPSDIFAFVAENGGTMIAATIWFTYE